MSYVKYSEIVDFKTGVENGMSWDAHHESIYGMSQFSYEECEKNCTGKLNLNT